PFVGHQCPCYLIPCLEQIGKNRPTNAPQPTATYTTQAQMTALYWRNLGIGKGSGATLEHGFGSLADKPSQAKIRRCPLLPNSGQTRARLKCPLCAKSRHDRPHSSTLAPK